MFSGAWWRSRSIQWHEPCQDGWWCGLTSFRLDQCASGPSRPSRVFAGRTAGVSNHCELQDSPGSRSALGLGESLGLLRVTRPRRSGTGLAGMFPRCGWRQNGWLRRVLRPRRQRVSRMRPWHVIGGDGWLVREPHPLKHHVVHPRPHPDHRLAAGTCFVLHLGRFHSHPAGRRARRRFGSSDPGAWCSVNVDGMTQADHAHDLDAGARSGLRRRWRVACLR